MVRKNIEKAITPRQAKILAAIVKENCDTGEPVGSLQLVKRGYFELSGPTIRNEMRVLEKLGYIYQPHTSAGRVPTDKGFRYFVNQVMDKVKLTLKERDQLRLELLKLRAAHAEMGRRLTKLLSEHSKQASFAIFPEEVATMGISKLMENPALPAEDAREIAKFFDNIDQYAEKILKDYAPDSEPRAFIGRELALSKKSDYSMIVSGLRLPSGKTGVIGLVGPKSMKYDKNLGLIKYIAKLLGGASVFLLLIRIVNL
jgi:transcriptional regulator of heat shock response